MRVVGPAPMGGDFIELVMDEPPLRKAMLRYSVNLLLLSLLVIGIAAAFVYLVLHYLFVRPMRRITGNMVAFRADPENADRIIAPSGRADEIGTAEQELATMQAELASMLQQKSRLAALGLAVSKINHDLRNLLGSAQLISDRLSSLPDPGVQRFAPKLMRALERAIAFCQSTLSYGRLQEPPPERRPILLEPLVDEVHETLGLGPDAPVRWISAVERGLVVEADYDQLFRILLNLARNALQALESRAARDPAAIRSASPGGARAQSSSSRSPTPAPAFPSGRGRISSRRSRVRPGPAAPVSASPSPPNSSAPMAAKSAWSKARSARRCGSPFPTAPWS